MDRDDARFIGDALACRIAGDREGLDRLAASSLMRLSALATVLRKQAAGWEPALHGSAELMSICRRGGALVDDSAPSPYLQNLVDSLRGLANEPPPLFVNRADRRRAGSGRFALVDRRRRERAAGIVH